jgi:hypothetical protein
LREGERAGTLADSLISTAQATALHPALVGAGLYNEHSTYIKSLDDLLKNKGSETQIALSRALEGISSIPPRCMSALAEAHLATLVKVHNIVVPKISDSPSTVASLSQSVPPVSIATSSSKLGRFRKALERRK